jgi:hypothetical protein
MCDYSLTHVRSRAAKIGEKLVTHNFGTGTRGFCSPDDPSTAVPATPQNTARFRQINKDVSYMHHDALELPDGQIILLTHLNEGQIATILQLPAEPRTAEEAQQQTRVAFTGEYQRQKPRPLLPGLSCADSAAVVATTAMTGAGELVRLSRTSIADEVGWRCLPQLAVHLSSMMVTPKKQDFVPNAC